MFITDAQKSDQSTREMFEDFYRKKMEDLTISDLGPVKEIDWGEDVGGERIPESEGDRQYEVRSE